MCAYGLRGLHEVYEHHNPQLAVVNVCPCLLRCAGAMQRWYLCSTLPFIMFDCSIHPPCLFLSPLGHDEHSFEPEGVRKFW